MTSNTPTSHMMAAANKFMELYMVEATNRFGIESSDPLDVLKKLWDEMQPKLQAEMDSIATELLAASSPKKRKRSSGRKRAKSAYIFFCKAERVTIKAESLDLAPKEVMVELGRRWREAKKGDISKWKELSAKDKARVEAESPAELATEFTEPKKKKKKKSSSKKGKSAYNFFCKAKRVIIKTENEGLAPREIMTELGKRWREAKKGDISKWKELSTKDKARCKKESEEEPALSPVPPVEKSVKKTVTVTKKSVKKKRIYAYSFWAKMHRSEIAHSTDLEGKELTKELSTQWKALSKEEKAEWKAAAVEATE